MCRLAAGRGETCAARYKGTGDEWAAPVALQRLRPGFRNSGIWKMTLPHERTRAVLSTQDFLLRLTSPYNGGIKGVPTPVREEARRLLRHYPLWFDLGRADAFDPEAAKRIANADER